MACERGSNQAKRALCNAGVPDSQRRASWAGDSPLWFSSYDRLTEMEGEIRACHPEHDGVATVSFGIDGNDWGRGTVSLNGANDGVPTEMGVREIDRDVAVSFAPSPASILPRENYSPVTIFTVSWEVEDDDQDFTDLVDKGRDKLRKEIGRSGDVVPDCDATIWMHPDGKKVASVDYSWAY